MHNKHINHGLEWDELAPMAPACYNFFPNCSARESAFSIMFGRDPINKLNMMLHAARRYFHDDNCLPNLEALKNIYQVVTQQLLNSRGRYIKKHRNQQPSESQLQAGDLILNKNHTGKSFKPKSKILYTYVWGQSSQDMTARQKTVTPASVLPSGNHQTPASME